MNVLRPNRLFVLKLRFSLCLRWIYLHLKRNIFQNIWYHYVEIKTEWDWKFEVAIKMRRFRFNMKLRSNFLSNCKSLHFSTRPNKINSVIKFKVNLKCEYRHLKWTFGDDNNDGLSNSKNIHTHMQTDTYVRRHDKEHFVLW